MLQEFCVPRLTAVVDMQQIIFQQDSQVRAYLDATFPDRWLDRRGPLEWTPRSPDLTPYGFFLWGFIKSKVYATKPRYLPTLEERIRYACASVTPEMSEDVKRACVKRWLDCYEKGDVHVKGISDLQLLIC